MRHFVSRAMARVLQSFRAEFLDFASTWASGQDLASQDLWTAPISIALKPSKLVKSFSQCQTFDVVNGLSMGQLLPWQFRKARAQVYILLLTPRSLHLATSSHLWLYCVNSRASPCFTARKQPIQIWMSAFRRLQYPRNVWSRLTSCALGPLINICSQISLWLTASRPSVWRVFNVSRPALHWDPNDFGLTSHWLSATGGSLSQGRRHGILTRFRLLSLLVSGHRHSRHVLKERFGEKKLSALGAPIPLLCVYAVSCTQCACQNLVLDQYGEHMLPCKKQTGAITGHDHVMNVSAQLARNSRACQL